MSSYYEAVSSKELFQILFFTFRKIAKQKKVLSIATIKYIEKGCDPTNCL